MLCRSRRQILPGLLFNKADTFCFSNLHLSTHVVCKAMSGSIVVSWGTWVVILPFLLLQVMESLLSISDHRPWWTRFFVFGLNIIRLWNELFTYKIDSCVFEAWSLVCLPAWLLNKSDAVFLVSEITLQFAFGKFPCSLVLVEVTAWGWFLLPLRLVTNIIGNCSSFRRKEPRSLSDWLLLPVDFGLVFGWPWHEILCNLGLLSEHASLCFLLFVTFNWEKVFDWGLRVIFWETERWYF